MSTPLCSFVVYLDQDADLVPSFMQDLRSFLNKFPLSYEVLFVVDKRTRDSRSLVEAATGARGERETITILENTHSLRRAESIRRGLNNALGLYLVVADLTIATPLGDLFKLLQHLMGEADLVEVCWGERYSKKSSAISNPQTPRHRLENLFNRILQEQRKSPYPDQLCETFGVSRETWKKIDRHLPRQVGWYLGPDIRRSSPLLNLKIQEIFVHDSGKSPRSYSLWRERWNLLKKSLF